MTRKLFFVPLLMMLAWSTVASPPPNVSFVFHNDTGVTLTDSRVYTHFSQARTGSAQNPGGGGGALDLTFGTILNGAAPTQSFGVVFEKSGMSNQRINFTANGHPQDMILSGYWDSWQNCMNCAYKYRMTWTDYRVDFYVQKP